MRRGSAHCRHCRPPHPPHAFLCRLATALPPSAVPRPVPVRPLLAPGPLSRRRCGHHHTFNSTSAFSRRHSRDRYGPGLHFITIHCTRPLAIATSFVPHTRWLGSVLSQTRSLSTHSLTLTPSSPAPPLPCYPLANTHSPQLTHLAPSSTHSPRTLVNSLLQVPASRAPAAPTTWPSSTRRRTSSSSTRGRLAGGRRGATGASSTPTASPSSSTSPPPTARALPSS